MKATDIRSAKKPGDLVLREVWRAKDSLSVSYNHDLDKLFAETREHEKRSGHPIANLPIKFRPR